MTEVTDHIKPDLKDVNIPAERVVKSEFDITLKPHEFLFNPGHVADIYQIGLLNPDDLYRVTGEIEGDGSSIFGVLNLDTVIDSYPYQEKQTDVLTALVGDFGDELRHVDADSDLKNLESYRKRVDNPAPNVSEKSRKDGESFVARLESRVGKKRQRSEHLANAANWFIKTVSRSGVNLTEIKRYEDTTNEINRVLVR